MRTMSRTRPRPASATCRMGCRIGDTIGPCRAGSNSRSGKRSHGCGHGLHRKAEAAMIDPKLLRSDPDAVARNLARRGYVLDVAALRALEEQRKPRAVEVDRLRAERNASAR